MKKFCIGIPLSEPKYSEFKFSEFLFLNEDLTKVPSERLFKVVEKGTEGVIERFLNPS